MKMLTSSMWEKTMKQVDTIIDEKKNLLLSGFIDLDALGDVDHSLIFIGFPQERRDDLVRILRRREKKSSLHSRKLTNPSMPIFI